jgi:5-methylcytosine-specific restriction endonuclease McrA
MSFVRRIGWRGIRNVRLRLMKDQDFTCFYCLRAIYVSWHDAPDLDAANLRQGTIDHIEPLSKGGSWKRYNLCAACRDCNCRKGTLSEEEFHEIIMEELSRSSFTCEESHA